VLELEAGASSKTRLLDALIQNTRFLQEQIEQAFPQCGATNNIFAIAHLLHPKHKGLVLQALDPPLFDSTCKTLIRTHRSTEQHYKDIAEKGNKPKKPKATAPPSRPLNPMEALLQKAAQRPDDEEEELLPIPPIQAQLKFFFDMTRDNNKDTDILGWWEDHAGSISQLADYAR
jgi:hypothetical protein